MGKEDQNKVVNSKIISELKSEINSLREDISTLQKHCSNARVDFDSPEKKFIDQQYWMLSGADELLLRVNTSIEDGEQYKYLDKRNAGFLFVFENLDNTAELLGEKNKTYRDLITNGHDAHEIAEKVANTDYIKNSLDEFSKNFLEKGYISVPPEKRIGTNENFLEKVEKEVDKKVEDYVIREETKSSNLKKLENFASGSSKEASVYADDLDKKADELGFSEESFEVTMEASKFRNLYYFYGGISASAKYPTYNHMTNEKLSELYLYENMDKKADLIGEPDLTYRECIFDDNKKLSVDKIVEKLSDTEFIKNSVKGSGEKLFSQGYIFTPNDERQKLSDEFYNKYNNKNVQKEEVKEEVKQEQKLEPKKEVFNPNFVDIQPEIKEEPKKEVFNPNFVDIQPEIKEEPKKEIKEEETPKEEQKPEEINSDDDIVEKELQQIREYLKDDVKVEQPKVEEIKQEEKPKEEPKPEEIDPKQMESNIYAKMIEYVDDLNSYIRKPFENANNIKELENKLRKVAFVADKTNGTRDIVKGAARRFFKESIDNNNFLYTLSPEEETYLKAHRNEFTVNGLLQEGFEEQKEYYQRRLDYFVAKENLDGNNINNINNVEDKVKEEEPKPEPANNNNYDQRELFSQESRKLLNDLESDMDHIKDYVGPSLEADFNKFIDVPFNDDEFLSWARYHENELAFYDACTRDNIGIERVMSMAGLQDDVDNMLKLGEKRQFAKSIVDYTKLRLNSIKDKYIESDKVFIDTYNTYRNNLLDYASANNIFDLQNISNDDIKVENKVEENVKVQPELKEEIKQEIIQEQKPEIINPDKNIIEKEFQDIQEKYLNDDVKVEEPKQELKQEVKLQDEIKIEEQPKEIFDYNNINIQPVISENGLQTINELKEQVESLKNDTDTYMQNFANARVDMNSQLGRYIQTQRNKLDILKTLYDAVGNSIDSVNKNKSFSSFDAANIFIFENLDNTAELIGENNKTYRDILLDPDSNFLDVIGSVENTDYIQNSKYDFTSDFFEKGYISVPPENRERKNEDFLEKISKDVDDKLVEYVINEERKGPHLDELKKIYDEKNAPKKEVKQEEKKAEVKPEPKGEVKQEQPKKNAPIDKEKFYKALILRDKKMFNAIYGMDHKPQNAKEELQALKTLKDRGLFSSWNDDAVANAINEYDKYLNNDNKIKEFNQAFNMDVKTVEPNGVLDGYTYVNMMRNLQNDAVKEYFQTLQAYNIQMQINKQENLKQENLKEELTPGEAKDFDDVYQEIVRLDGRLTKRENTKHTNTDGYDTFKKAMHIISTEMKAQNHRTKHNVDSSYMRLVEGAEKYMADHVDDKKPLLFNSLGKARQERIKTAARILTLNELHTKKIALNSKEGKTRMLACKLVCAEQLKKGFKGFKELCKDGAFVDALNKKLEDANFIKYAENVTKKPAPGQKDPYDEAIKQPGNKFLEKYQKEVQKQNDVVSVPL